MESAPDIGTCEVLACDESFFTALLAADHELLAAIPADDFPIIDVLAGQVAHREELLGAISSGQLRFAEVTRHAENARSAFVTRPRWWPGGPGWSPTDQLGEVARFYREGLGLPELDRFAGHAGYRLRGGMVLASESAR